jgi:hypothetical protein
MQSESTFGEIQTDPFQISSFFLCRSKTPIPLFMKSRKRLRMFCVFVQDALSLSFPLGSSCRAIVLQSQGRMWEAFKDYLEVWCQLSGV